LKATRENAINRIWAIRVRCTIPFLNVPRNSKRRKVKLADADRVFGFAEIVKCSEEGRTRIPTRFYRLPARDGIVGIKDECAAGQQQTWGLLLEVMFYPCGVHRILLVGDRI
jgi:hypothetical protein